MSRDIKLMLVNGDKSGFVMYTVLSVLLRVGA